MQLPKNKFKLGLAGDRPTFGAWMGIPDTTCAEIMAGAGFDWVVVDAEHGPFDLPSVQRHLQAIEAYPVSPIVRAVEGQTAHIKQLLDAGAQTLLIPMVDNAQQAETIVRAAYYPPRGIRGMGTALARASRWNRIADYAARANDEICLIAQIESVEGMDKAKEIAAVDGIDALFVGPADLSASMGFVGQPNHPEVIEAIHSILKDVVESGKFAGVLAVTPDRVADYLNHGAKFVGVGVDTTLLANAATQLAARYIETSRADTAADY